MGRPGFGEPGRSSRKGQPPRVSGTRSPSDRRLVGQLVGAARRRRPLASTSPSHSPPHHSCPPPYHPPNPAPAVPAGGAWRRRRRRRLGRARRSCGTSPPLPSTCSSDLPFQPDPVQGPDPGSFIGSRPSRAAPRRRKSRQKTTNYLSQQQIDTIKTMACTSWRSVSSSVLVYWSWDRARAHGQALPDAGPRSILQIAK